MSLMLLTSLLSINTILSMERKDSNIQLAEEFLESVKEESRLQVAITATHVKSILDKSKDLEEAISVVTEDFKNLNDKNAKDLYSKTFRYLAKQKYTAALAHENKNNLKIDLDFSKLDSRERLIKVLLVKEQFEVPVQMLIKSNSAYEFTTEKLLTYLVHENELILVKFLIICGADLNEQTQKGFTLLHIALAQNNLNMVDLLQKFGAISTPYDSYINILQSLIINQYILS